MSVRAAYWTTLLRPPRAVQFPFTLSGGGNSANLLPSAGLTFECWVYIEAYANPPGSYSGSDTTQTLLLTSGSNSWSFYCCLNQGKLSFFNYTTPNLVIQTQAAVPAKTWQHLAMVIKPSGYVRFYLGGQPAPLQGQESHSMPLGEMNPASSWNIGHVSSARASTPLYGKMAELRLWGTARSDQDISESYRSSNSYLLRTGKAPNILACYDFAEETGAAFLSPATGPANPLLADGSGHGYYLGSSSNGWENSTVPITLDLLR